MLRYLIRRLGRGILTIFVSVTLVFFIVRAMPSDPVALMISQMCIRDRGSSVTLRFKGGGPIGSITAVADPGGNVRGYVQELSLIHIWCSPG